MVTLKFWVLHVVTKTFKKIHAVTLSFTKLFHNNLLAHKTLENINFKALRLLYAYLSPFQVPSVSIFSLKTKTLTLPSLDFGEKI